MSIFMQLFYFACYAVAAAVAAVVLPRVVPSLDPPLAWIVGALIFVIGVVVHEIAVRRRNETQTQHRLILLHRAQSDLREEIARLAAAAGPRIGMPVAETPGSFRAEDPPVRREPTLAPAAGPPNRGLVADRAQRVRVSLPESRIGGPSAPSRTVAPDGSERLSTAPSDELAAEVKVLHSLVQRLYLPKGAGEGSDINDPGGTSVDPSDRILIDRVRDAMRHNQVQLFVQPIVALPQRKRRFSQCSLHVRPADGVAMEPDRYLAAARRGGLETEIDNMLLFRSIQILRKAKQQNYTTAFFCGISTRSLNDRKFFPGFLAYLGKCADLAPNVVFEVARKDLVDPEKEIADDLRTLVAAGFRLCLADVDDIDLDVPTLAELGVCFVRLDATLLMPAAEFDMEANRVRVLKQALDRAGVDLIVGNIENEPTLVELLDFNIDLGQGTLFGEPREFEEVNGEPDAPRVPSRVNEA